MTCAFITATRFVFVYDGIRENIQLGQIGGQILKKAKKAREVVQRPREFGHQQFVNEGEEGYDSYPPGGGYDGNTGYGQGGDQYGGGFTDKRVEINLQGENGVPPGGAVDDVSDGAATGFISTHIPRGMPGQSGTMPGWMTVIRRFGTIHYGAMLYLTWFMGFGVGLMFTFLFWHLQVSLLCSSCQGTH